LISNSLQPHFLYHNNGNSNHWLRVRCVGTISNRSAIGAKVRLQARINGVSVWQMREISGGTGYGSQNMLDAHFGLGQAAKADTLVIEWPSGIRQEMHDLPVNRILTISESPMLKPGQRQPGGNFEVILTSRGGYRYLIEASTNLVDWIALTTLSNVNGQVQFVDTNAYRYPQRFYRAKTP